MNQMTKRRQKGGEIEVKELKFLEFLNGPEKNRKDFICLEPVSVFFCTVTGGYTCVDPQETYGCGDLTPSFKCLPEINIIHN